ncbi:hypothetical protein Tco_0610073, partial [Tanacetum coccineum]
TRDVNADEIVIPAVVVNHGAHVYEDNSIVETSSGNTYAAGYTSVCLNTVTASPSNFTAGLIDVAPTCMPNVVNSGPTSPNKNGGNQVGNEFPSSYANKLSPTSLTKANLQKLKVNVPDDADYDVWLPLALVYEVNDKMKNSMYIYFIGKRLAFPVVERFVHNNWEKYGLKKGSGYTKETIRVEYEWVPPRASTCLIYDHSLVDCPKAAPKRAVNGMDKGKGQTSVADDKRFIKVKKKNHVNSFEALNVENPVIEEVETGDHGSDDEVEYGTKSLLKK